MSACKNCKDILLSVKTEHLECFRYYHSKQDWNGPFSVPIIGKIMQNLFNENTSIIKLFIDYAVADDRNSSSLMQLASFANKKSRLDIIDYLASYVGRYKSFTKNPMSVIVTDAIEGRRTISKDIFASEPYLITGEVLIIVSRKGNLHMLKEIIQVLITNNLLSETLLHNTDIINEAAHKGFTEIVIYLHSCGFCWDKWTANFASIAEHIELLKYLLDNGCPFDKFIWKTDNMQIISELHRQNLVPPPFEIRRHWNEYINYCFKLVNMIRQMRRHIPKDIYGIILKIIDTWY